ncbi:MAG TPA: lysophospholipid acyltransferase family protein [Desulfobacterales bacterium]|nr:lysophospholipid acyltransferase family protein [Desulfobacterales bacterium]
MEEALFEDKIFSIVPKTTGKESNEVLSIIAGPLEHLLGLRQCTAIYEQVKSQCDSHLFMRAVLRRLDVRPVVKTEDLENIPKKGPVVVVGNHPFGGIEGIILADTLLSCRPDVKIMANSLLNRIPQLRDLTIPVDPFSRSGSVRGNIGPMRDALRWLKNGGMLLVFPAGEVSHLRLESLEVADPVWSPTIGRIIRHARIPILPVFFGGHNGPWFQAAGLIHPRLRTALLARQLISMRGKTVSFDIGRLIPFRWLERYAGDAELMAYLRWRTYLLGHAARRKDRPIKAPIIAGFQKPQPLARAQDPALCRREIERLPVGQRLAQSGAQSVWQATAEQIPHLLLEIGRLRELSFRAASEGSGKSMDLDRFDAHYLHLFIWNAEAAEIVGAYRVGATDRVLERHGRQGLYSSTLFDSRMELFRRLGPALELGRSFVRPEYQRSYSPLLLLWKGIGGFIARHPRYRMLFGPVSISRDYSDLSRRLIATTLLQHSQAKDLALMVKPRNPANLKPVRIRGCGHPPSQICFQDFKEVCSVIADVEFKHRDVPVLLRHYLNLGGQILAFNIDRTFGNAMDGLIVVDLTQTDRKTLQRYLGAEGAAAFLAYHESVPTNDSVGLIKAG